MYVPAGARHRLCMCRHG